MANFGYLVPVSPGIRVRLTMIYFGVERTKENVLPRYRTAQSFPEQSSLPESPLQIDPQLNNPIRQVTFLASLGLIFLRYSLLHEVIARYIGANTYILYFFAIPAIFGVLATGGVRRTLALKPAKLWMGFILWMILATPFSTWRGGSAQLIVSYLRTDLPMLFVLGGLVLTWAECNRILYAIGIAGCWIVFAGKLLKITLDGERAGLQFGMVANPNDYAAHLILVLPIILYLVFNPPRILGVKWPLRMAGIAAVSLGLYLILATASRGALLALIIGFVFVMFYSKPIARVALFVGTVLAVFLLIAALPGKVLSRLQIFSSDSSAGDEDTRAEALGSSNIRQYLLKQSLLVSLQHPVFGVGPGQFVNYMGETVGNNGPMGVAVWRHAHNSFTEISADCGLPAFFFYVTAVITSYWMLHKTWKRVRVRADLNIRSDLQQMSQACYCISLSYVTFLVAIFFLNFGFLFYLPAATGLIVALTTSVDRGLAANTVGTSAQVSVANASTRPLYPQAVRLPVSRPAFANRPIRFNGYRR